MMLLNHLIFFINLSLDHHLNNDMERLLLFIIIYGYLAIHNHSLFHSNINDLILYMVNVVINASSINYHFISMVYAIISFSNTLCHQSNMLILVINLSNISYRFFCNSVAHLIIASKYQNFMIILRFYIPNSFCL